MTDSRTDCTDSCLAATSQRSLCVHAQRMLLDNVRMHRVHRALKGCGHGQSGPGLPFVCQTAQPGRHRLKTVSAWLRRWHPGMDWSLLKLRQQAWGRTRLPDGVAGLRVVCVHISVLPPARVAVQAHAGVTIQNLQGDEDIWVRLPSRHRDAIQVGKELRTQK